MPNAVWRTRARNNVCACLVSTCACCLSASPQYVELPEAMAERAVQVLNHRNRMLSYRKLTPNCCDCRASVCDDHAFFSLPSLPFSLEDQHSALCSEIITCVAEHD